MLGERLGREREKEGVREEILSLLAMHDTTVEEAVRAENIKRMQLKNIMRDSVNSLKNLATLDRRQLVTGLSRTFAILMEDDVFAHMDDPSPVSYTHLDVYKRQSRASGKRTRWKIWCWRPCRPCLLYTSEMSEAQTLQIAKSMFRYAVEMELSMRMFSEITDCTPSEIEDMRKDAIRNVRRTRGKVRLDDLFKRKEDVYKRQPVL